MPPFTRATATQKVRLAEDAWNSRDPARVALAYTSDSRWRNRSEFLQGRAAIEEFLTRKWQREKQYRLVKELWAFHDNRIAVRFAYEWPDHAGQWWRSYGNENVQAGRNQLLGRDRDGQRQHIAEEHAVAQKGQVHKFEEKYKKIVWILIDWHSSHPQRL